MPRPGAAPTMAASMRDDPAEEANEPEIVAEPRLNRSALGYIEPRVGIDGASSFCQCDSCMHFVPENAMRGAVVGDRCLILGATFPVSGESSCAYFLPWPTGAADADDVSENAEDMIEGERGSITPYDAGFVRDTKVRCMNCRSFESDESECSLYEALNDKLPNVWQLDCSVKGGACCSCWNAMPQPTMGPL